MNNDLPHNESMFYGASALIFKRAKELRGKETKAELMLWKKLSGKKLGMKFRRQHPLYKFIADFYCHKLKLVIELDGGIHSNPEAREYDEMRTDLIREFGIEVIRFTNEEIFDEIESTINNIKTTMRARANMLSTIESISAPKKSHSTPNVNRTEKKSPSGDLGANNHK